MRTLLGTTAVAAALMLAAPAFAQQSYYDTNPTPQERAQTNTLNGDAANDAAKPMPPAADDADYAAKKADYDRKMDEYNAAQARYRAEHARYQDERAGYVHHWDVLYGYREFRDIGEMSGADLVGLHVSARGGEPIGRIRDIDTRDGRVVRVSIATGDGDRVWLDANDLRFDPAEREVKTDMTRHEIDHMSRPAYPRF